MTEAKSRLIGRFETSATPENKRPAMTGTFALADEAQSHSFRVWSGVSENGRAYLRGTHEPETLTGALRARHSPVAEADGPPGISLAPGELVLFENTATAANDKRPNWYGFARTHEGYVRLSGWDRTGEKGIKLLAGTAEPYRPAEAATDRRAKPEELAH